MMNDTTRQLQSEPVGWVRAQDKLLSSTDTEATSEALRRATSLWGKTDLSDMFYDLLAKRGTTIYDRSLEHHFTGSCIVINQLNHKVLMTFHPYYQIWQQLGGHDEGEQNPLSVAAREAWEESGIDDLWVCDWPVRIDPHPAQKCRTVPGDHGNYHYDICYMAVAANDDFKMSDESVDMAWFSIDEIKKLVAQDAAQKRALEMAQNSLKLLEACEALDLVPPKLRDKNE